MSQDNWRPSAAIEAIRGRAALLAELRQFFLTRGVLEVETPLLGHCAGTDPQLDPVRVDYPGADTAYLQTSPEFAMKRLLAAGSGPIYQITRSFREGDQGRLHNPEFTLVEWYQPGFDEHRLMDEVTELLQAVMPHWPTPERRSYRDIFQKQLGIDPHEAPNALLRSLAKSHLDIRFELSHRDGWLDLLYSHLIEPTLQAPCFIHDYPASQAALARLKEDAEGSRVACRFELVAGGMELANGYYELLDAGEQASRFQADLAYRHENGKAPIREDKALLGALRAGLPDCSGVALGVDRLLMQQLGIDDIRQVLSFDFSRV